MDLRLTLSVFWIEIMRVQQSAGSFALCIEDGGMEDLEARKVYQVLPDREASREGYVRVIDESGEDYIHNVSTRRHQPPQLQQSNRLGQFP
jgi:hypothetical protein